MVMSAFGVEDNRLSKADDRRQRAISGATAGGAGAGVGLMVGREVPKFRKAMQYHRGVKRLSEAAKKFAEEDPIYSAYNVSQARRYAATSKRLVQVGSKRAVIGGVVGGVVGGVFGHEYGRRRYRS